MQQRIPELSMTLNGDAVLFCCSNDMAATCVCGPSGGLPMKDPHKANLDSKADVQTLHTLEAVAIVS